jgi:hypothetical protein
MRDGSVLRDTIQEQPASAAEELARLPRPDTESEAGAAVEEAL